jgi:sugar-specific transcriptional regulator TrmB
MSYSRKYAKYAIQHEMQGTAHSYKSRRDAHMSDDAVTKSVLTLRDGLGLTEAEAKAVVPIYLGGNLTAGGVALLTGEKLSTVQRTLGRLVNKGLIRQIDGIVPVYQALAPSLALSGTLGESLDNIRSVTGESEQMLSSRIEDAEKSIESLLETQAKSLEDVKAALVAYEEQTLDLVRNQINTVVTTTTNTMTSFSDEIELAMNGLEATLDESLGTKLLELQAEIDKAQVAMEKDLKAQVRDFDKWLKTERKSSLVSVGEFEVKSANLVKSAKIAISRALSKSSESIQNLAREISGKLTSLASTASDSGIEVINEVSTEVSQLLNRLDSDLSQAYLTGQESLKEIINQARGVYREYSEFAKGHIDAAVEIADSVGGVVDDWRTEVSGFMDIASQSVTSQLDQVAATDASYLEVTQNALTAHIERVNASLDDEYTKLSALASTLGTDSETVLADTRSMVLELLQSQNAAEQADCDVAAGKLDIELDKWVGDTVASIEKTLNDTSRDVSNVLDTETSELNSISDAMNSRLKSAFNSVIKSTTTKNETLLTTVKKATHDFENNIGERLEELIGSFIVATEKQVKESKELYEKLRERLDNRMTQSVSAINSQADRIQKEISNTISEQTGRIDLHSQAIRDEFHNRLEDITSQFLSLTQGLEATFNGLLSSQTVEARDLISSAHSEFRTVLKSEVSTLKDDSVKVQQEYSTELALKIDDVASSVASVKKALNELAVEKRYEISESMSKTLADLEASIRSTEESLRDIESGTVAQFIDNMEQVSQEFKVTVAGARDNISERLGSVKNVIAASLTKSSASAKVVVDGFVADQKDSKQRYLADTSKKMNRLGTKRAKDLTSSIENFQFQSSERQTTGVKERSIAKEEVLAAVETRRSEVANAFDAAAVWVDSSVANIATSLDAFGTKLKNELVLMQRGLQKAGEEAASAILERGEADLDNFQEISSTLFQNAESIVTTHLNEFGDSVSSALSKSNDSFTSMPTKVSEELSQLDNEIEKSTAQDYTTITNSLSTSFTDCTRTAESISEGFKNLLETTSLRLTQHRDETFEQVRKSTELSNQYASRKFESIGLDLKTKLSNDSSELLDKARLAFTSSTKDITDAVTKTTNSINELTSALKQSRTKALSQYGESSEKTLRRWSKEQKDQMSSLKERVHNAIIGVTEKTEETINVLNAIHQAGEGLARGPEKRTWYVSGKEEACAHITDMAERAEDSVVISIVDSSCLDYKKLAKVKQPKRKILVIPETEEQDPDLATLDGWRIWETKTPMFISVIDDREILVGGATSKEEIIALVSEDETYLRLYHDILGPRLVRGRVT